MLDCLSNGRLISGFARGIPREYQVHNVPLAESRARFEEAFDIVTRAWTEDVFSYEGKFWSYKDVAIWPRPVQQPRPADLDPDRRQQGIDRVRRQARHPDHAGPGRRRAARRHHRAITPSASPMPAIASRPTICRSASTPMSPIPRPRRSRRWRPITSISIARCSATATSPRPRCSARRATRARARPTMCGRRTSAPPPCCARISATSPWPMSSARPRACRGARRRK